jgi:hypothetical protein
MPKVTGGRWPKNVSIPRAAGEDIFTSRMAHDLKIFPYGRNVAAVESVVMEKDRQDAAQKRRAVVRIGDPFREAKRVRGGGASLVPLAVASQRRLRSRPPLGPRSLRRVRRLPLLARANHPRASPSRGEGCPHRRVLMRWGRVSPTSTETSMCRIILLVSFFRSLTNIMVQARMRGNCLLSRLRWRPLRLRRRLGRRVLRGTRGPPSARAARFHRPPPLRMWRAPCPSR